MIGYGMAKAAVIHLTKSFAAEGSGMPKGSKTFCILPVTLDTTANRSAMPNADFSTWTPMTAISSMFEIWLKDRKAVNNGSLIDVVTKQGETTFHALTME